MIFARPPGADHRPIRTGESEFKFWERIAGAVGDRVRSTLEEWFSHYPAEARGEWLGLFRSRNVEQHRAALWELYLHEALRRTGWTVTVHPSTPGGRRPDFRVERSDSALYLEATTCFLDLEPTAVEAVRREIYEALEEVNSPNFWMNVHFEREASRPPKRRPLARSVEAWLGTLNVDEIVASQSVSNSERVSRVFDAGEWQIRIGAWAKSPGLRRDPSGKSLGFLHSGGGFYDSRRPIRDKLNDKARHYGILDAPLVLAVSLQSSLFDRESQIEALFGSTEISVAVGAEVVGEPQWVRRRDGFFVDESPRAQQVAGVVFGERLRPEGLLDTKLTTWHHPWASKPFGVELPWTSVRLDESDGSLTDDATGAVEPVQLFDLDPRWPGPEELFDRPSTTS